MLGDFIHSYTHGRSSQITVLNNLPAGTPVVAMDAPGNLKEGLLCPRLFFAILSDNPGLLIGQNVISDSEDGLLFEVQEFEAPSQLAYFTYEIPDMELPQALKRAQSKIGRRYEHVLRSYPGDDFVDECLTGRDIQCLFGNRKEEAGQHWWTPLEVTAQYVLDNLIELIEQETSKAAPPDENFLERKAREAKNKILKQVSAGIKKVSLQALQKMTLPQLEHHAILLEGSQCILFTEGSIRFMTKANFCNMTPNTPIGGPAKGLPQGKADVESRLNARNRAVRRICREAISPGEWGNFNIILNNSEHFCRDCREGAPSCTQLPDKIIKSIDTILGIILPGWASMVKDIIFKYFDPTPGTHGQLD